MAMAMASTSSSVASMAVTVPLKKHDVFISFRGEDTRGNFTSHLHAALRRSYIETYIDYRIDRGEEVWAELVKAIKDSSVLLVLFSENYASSTWCLDELVEITECKKNGQGQDVIPVFYKIEPSHVRKQTGSYHTAFVKHKQSEEKKMQKWKDALCEAANLCGFHSRLYRTEFDLIEDITKTVLRKLNHKHTNELGGYFISDENFSHIESLLRIDSKQVQIIGIWGMGGIGKTTLAAAIFHKFSHQYEGSCFLESVTEDSKKHGLGFICNRLLSTLLMEDLHIATLKVIPSNVVRRISRMKAFVVLDDLNASDLLENLVGVWLDWLGAGSRVIVTTRDKHVLISGGVDKIHGVKEMNFQNSLRLFCLNAFNETHPKQGYNEVSKRAVDYAKGIPLALKVLGSFLRSKSEKEWDSALTKLKKIPNAEIQKVLRLSYDELDDKEKNIFLDIACFFKGHGRDNVEKILNACGFFADIGIRNLIDKALISVDMNNCIEMHDLIREMGREIVREESIKNPGRRSRLWDPEEVCDVLTNNRGTGEVEAIFLDMTQITFINLSSKAFKKMPNLRLISFEAFNQDFKRINSVFLPRGLDLLPKNLRYFGWDGYPLKSLPSTFCPEMLVELSLPYSNVKKLWNGVQNLPNLEMLDLNGSRYLRECPNLSRAPNLKYVKLSNCVKLPSVDPSIFSLEKLKVLNVGGCMSLKSLGSKTCSPSLQGLYAWGCYNLQEFSVTLMATTTRLCLNLGGSGLNELPSSILQIKNLENFSFPISDGLMDLPENFAPKITLSGSGKHERDTFFTLHKVLPSPGFRSTRCLVFDFCHNLSAIPDNISLLSSLQHLILVDSAIISLPESLKYLPRLKLLEVNGCKILRSIPTLPRSIQCFHVWNCESLQTVLSSTSEPSEKPKCTFMLPNCIKLGLHSYDTILKDAIARIEHGAKQLATLLKNKENASLDHDDDEVLCTSRSGKICYFLPAISDKVRDWFHYHSTQSLVTVELPSNLLGFAYYLVLSQVQSCHIGGYGSLGSKCYLETSWGESIYITSFFVDENTLLNPDTSFEMMSDHVLLWYDAQCCKKIMEVVKERKAINDMSTTHNPNLTFIFFAKTQYDEVVAIKECGIRWIYPLEDQIVKEGGRCKSKRSREIYELETNNVVQNRAERSQEENVPPTKKLKQVDQEMEDLRCLLEELLHIEFGRDRM